MKILNSPFNHKEVCKCGCVLNYKDTDIISSNTGSFNTKIIKLSEYPELIENIKNEHKLNSVAKTLLSCSDATLKVTYRRIYFKLICPFCGNEIDIYTYDSNKQKIFREATMCDYILSSKSYGKKEDFYRWYGKRVQLLIEQKLLPADVLKD